MPTTSPVFNRLLLSALVWHSTVAFQSQLQAQQPETTQQDDLFLFPPKTPSRQIRGAVLAERLGRPDLARHYLNQVIEAQLTSEQLVQLRQEFGIGQFLKLSAIKELQPPARDLLRSINAATRQEGPSASTVEILIAELGQSEQQTLNASLRILSAEDDAVLPLLSTDPATPQGEIADRLLHKYVRRFRFGLLNALPEATDDQKLRILDMLSQSVDSGIVPDLHVYRFHQSAPVAAAARQTIQKLSGNLPTESALETANRLTQHSLELLAFAGQRFPSELERRELNVRRRPSADNADSEVEFGDASLSRAVELVGWAVEIAPDSVEARAAQLVVNLTAKSWPAKWPENPVVPTQGTAVTADEVETTAMQIAIDSGNAASMLALLNRSEQAFAVLSHRADLLRQLTFQSDSRVRLFAAAFRNSIGGESSGSRTILQNAVDGSKKPEAVVIDSRLGGGLHAQSVLNMSGYAATAAASGQGGFDIATEQLGCELIAVQSNCLRWSLSDTITNLRKDYRTATTPIIIFGPERDRPSFETLAHRFEGIWFLPEPLSEITFEDASRLAGVPAPVLSEEERVNMINYARTLTLTD